MNSTLVIKEINVSAENWELEEYVVYYFELSSASLQWNINFLGAAHDWEMDLFTSLYTLLYSIRVRWGMEDRLC
jgi:hypothetical protein